MVKSSISDELIPMKSCWKRDMRGQIYNHRKNGKVVIVQEGSNNVLLLDWNSGKRRTIGNKGSFAKSTIFAKSYMKKHGGKC